MPSKREVVRRDLNLARSIAAKALSNFQAAKTPTDVAYWQREWQDASAEVRRLQRKLAS
jgi:hypothetical protein